MLNPHLMLASNRYEGGGWLRCKSCRGGLRRWPSIAQPSPNPSLASSQSDGGALPWLHSPPYVVRGLAGGCAMARRDGGLLPIGSVGTPNNWTKRIWIPTIGREHAADYEKLKTKLDVLQTARDHGASVLPKRSERALNEIQLRIIEEIFRGIALLNQFLADQVGAAIDDILSLRVPRLDETAEKAAMDRAFDRAAMEHRQEMQALAEKEVEAHVDLRYFKANNNLHRAAKYKASILLPLAQIAAVLVIESVFNGLLLQDISTQGAVGGVSMALGISAVNVGFGWIGGLVGWRLLGHRKLSAKAFGLIVTLVALTVGATWNIGVGHFREAVTELVASGAHGRDIMKSAGSALKHAQEHGVFGFSGLYSWLLFLLGLGSHLFASFKSWDGIADRYWDYASQDRSYERARREFAEAIGVIEHNVHAAVEEVIQAGVNKTKSSEATAAEIEGCLELALQREKEVRDSELDWVRKGEALLRAYREENEKVRMPNTSPDYFAVFPTVDDYRRGALGLTANQTAYHSATTALAERLDRLRDVLANARLDVEENARIERRLRVHADGVLATASTRIGDLESDLKARADRAIDRKKNLSDNGLQPAPVTP